MHKRKQIKITKLFGKIAKKAAPSDNCAELEEKIKQLEETLSDKQNELFQLQRNSYRHKTKPPKTKNEPFIRPETIVISNSLDTLKNEFEVMSMLTGIEIQSYVDNEHCTVVYHMQHDAPHEIKHGLMIVTKNGEQNVSKSSLPVGFNLSAVLSNFSKIMVPECLIAIRTALVAYYDRMQQYNNLKNLVHMEAQLFKFLDSSHIEIGFEVRNEHDPSEEPAQVKLILDYRVCDIRPKLFSFADLDTPQEVIDALRGQCCVFKNMPLDKAFKKAFIDGNGAYIIVENFRDEPLIQKKRQKPNQFRPANNNNNNDDTFRPEDYSESDDAGGD